MENWILQEACIWDFLMTKYSIEWENIGYRYWNALCNFSITFRIGNGNDIAQWEGQYIE